MSASAHVLVVEDLEDDLMLTKRALKHISRQVDIRVAVDGQEAVDVLLDEGWRPDLVLLDLKLPKLSGLDVLERLRAKIQSGLAVVVISSSDEPRDIERAMALGAAAYVPKPVIPQDYIEAVRAICERKLSA